MVTPQQTKPRLAAYLVAANGDLSVIPVATSRGAITINNGNTQQRSAVAATATFQVNDTDGSTLNRTSGVVEGAKVQIRETASNTAIFTGRVVSVDTAVVAGNIRPSVKCFSLLADYIRLFPAVTFVYGESVTSFINRLLANLNIPSTDYRLVGTSAINIQVAFADGSKSLFALLTELCNLTGGRFYADGAGILNIEFAAATSTATPLAIGDTTAATNKVSGNISISQLPELTAEVVRARIRPLPEED